MNCLKPVKISLSDDERIKRFNSDAPLEYRLATHIFVPCGKCEACLSKRKQQWIFRLTKEFENCLSAYFITLTYDDENLPLTKNGIPYVSKKDVQLFLKRFRKKIVPFKIRYFIISEYGPQTLRPHYHGIIFNFPHELSNKFDEYLTESWNLGFVTASSVTPARIRYVSGYCLATSERSDYPQKNFLLCSRKPGIGFDFCDNPNVLASCIARNTDTWCVADSGEAYEVRLPRYYRDKLFSDDFKRAMSVRYSSEISRDFNALLLRQRRFLEKKGIEVNYITLHSPIDGSPYLSFLQSKDEYRRVIRSKSKDKKIK